jgi:hypothetical protein
LKRTIEPIEVPEGDVILMRSCDEHIRIHQPDPSERALLKALDGSNSVGELEERFGSGEVRETLAKMKDLNLIEDAAEEDQLAPAVRERFDRQLRYFGDVARQGSSGSAASVAGRRWSLPRSGSANSGSPTATGSRPAT